MNPQHIEEAALNAWPALQTNFYDGWLMRTANRYTKRANSVTPLYDAIGILPLDEKISHVEAFYRNEQQRPIFRLPSFVELDGLDGRLADLGYQKLDLTSVQTLDLSYCGAIGSDRACILPSYSGMESWLGSFHQLSGDHRTDVETHQRLLENILGETCYMVLMVEGEVVACGLAVESGGLVGIFDVVTAPEHRRKGYGLELMEALLEWAVNTHAHHAYLQVMLDNQPALTLYKKLRFKELYRYWYRAGDEERGR